MTTSTTGGTTAGSTGRARLEDVAARVGVSVATASRVANGRPGVAADVRQAVMTAMDDLGYARPERPGAARGQVGVVIPDLVNPIFPAMAQAVSTLLARERYVPALCPLPGGGITEDEHVQMLLDHQVRGVVFVCAAHADLEADQERYARLRARGLPHVFVNGTRRPLTAPSVAVDDAGAVAAAVRHLVELGHERVGLVVGPDRFVPNRLKAEGFRRALAEHLGTAPADADRRVAVGMHTVEGGRAAAGDLVDAGCTGLVCVSDVMALGAVRAVRSRGLRVPDDVSVTGFDDSPLMAHTDPPLTTLRQPVAEMAEAAVDALMAQLTGRRAPLQEVLFTAELVLRGSTARAPQPSRP
ncbi:LacI family DNA-binding transcriptional regulator [Pseudokineococcus marinus]|uniref:LacI family DNA-binding transcriptional regulator n=1 Tax=Pseudokineococcus marinus TaxID=351215 RepID=A0A849BPF2_9ACTN|nr:LacI family DNA-binding transcriptional regulator [Pseudokineococcus marinus]NNH22907.1 LacI family DNA-binding transcriptional regulator [Pseudokineococcus marinus]